MKLRTYGVVLSLFFALGLVFSFSVEASASHGDGTGIEAEAVNPTDEPNVRAFLDHIIDYYNHEYERYDAGSPEQTRALTIYGRQLRQEGAYKNSGPDSKEMYSIGLNENGVLTNHSRYPNLFGYQFDSSTADSAVASTIQALIEGSGVGMTDCKKYGGQDRVACATKVASTTGNVTVIAGLHHEEDDSAFVAPSCDGFGLAPSPSAEDVFNNATDDNLEAYVKGIIGVVQQQISAVSLRVGFENLELSIAANEGDMEAAHQLAQITLQEIYSNIACFGSGDFKHENIYAFVMSAGPTSSTVLVNGNNFDLNGANLELNDDQLPGDDKSIAGLFNRELAKAEEAGGVGSSTYVNYRWDDPTNDEDDVENFLRDNKVPGTSCKRSYIEVADINEVLRTAVPDPSRVPPTLFIFGSGTYPEDDVCASGDGGDGGEMMPASDDDDDGCAIAGAGHTSQSALLNMFLIASVLFSVVFLRRRV